jgi:hypothetical protein
MRATGAPPIMNLPPGARSAAELIGSLSVTISNVGVGD